MLTVPTATPPATADVRGCSQPTSTDASPSLKLRVGRSDRADVNEIGASSGAAPGSGTTVASNCSVASVTPGGRSATRGTEATLPGLPTPSGTAMAFGGDA